MTLNGLPWASRPEVKKGLIGEALVDEFLRAKKIIPYRPDYEGAHPFDRLCATADKRSIFVADIKSKPKRNNYPDTGFDLNHYGDYKHIQNKYGLRIFIFFVDENAKQIYGNWLTRLEDPCTVEWNGKLREYPMVERWNGKQIIYFPITNMEFISEIDFKKAQELMRQSTRTYAYANNGQDSLL